MENILKMANAIDEQWVKSHQQIVNKNDNYKSIFKINGKSIMSPLMTPERRLEMQQHRQAAMAIEKQVALMSKLPIRVKKEQPKKCANASTNTDGDAKIIVMGHRFPQKLQMSQTLIYDNKCNAIIKLNKLPIVQSVRPWIPQLEPQYPVSIKAMPKFARLESMGGKLDAFVLMELGLTPIIYHKTEQEQLQRASTSPLLQSPKTPTDDRLQSQLWKRYHSYPLDTPEQISANTTLIFDSNKLESKQQLQPSTPVNSSKVSPCLKTSGSKVKKRASRPTYSSAAHAHSHAKAEREACSDSATRISCTQRRLSYDPRATQRKKKTPGQAVHSGADLKKKKLLDSMEQEQRQRFQQLVSQQAVSQQRLQVEFQLQQQNLIDQMLEENDAQSESSSSASLPQSRPDLDIDDVE